MAMVANVELAESQCEKNEECAENGGGSVRAARGAALVEKAQRAHSAMQR